MKLALTLFLFLQVNFAMAYDARKCLDFMRGKKEDSDWKKAGKGFFSVTVVPVSTSQFLSSWGECSFLEQEKVVFFLENFDKIRQDSTKGNGEYLLAYSKLSGCNAEEGTRVMASAQRNYETLFVKNEDPQVIYLRLESILNEVCI